MPKIGREKERAIHPLSRKAAKLCRTAHRDKRLERKQKGKDVRVTAIGEKLTWFHEHLDAEKSSYSKQDIHDLIQLYLARFDEELEQIAIKNSLPGRSGLQHVSRTQAVKNTIADDLEQYNGPGLEVPDLINGKNLKMFREWEGELRYIQNIKMRKMKAADNASEKEVIHDDAASAEGGYQEKSQNSGKEESHGDSDTVDQCSGLDVNEVLINADSDNKMEDTM